ncbi:MAG TPA: hypothetical protein PKH69_01640 [Thiobacillaceae bacterium]|nr:hypothetical protein [Thiobacillaceae bacterium]HNU64722.1 hypothetical protein [Thiobacillaceae bacterium]
MKKNIVEGVGGVLIGAAVVLLLARLFRSGKAETGAEPPPTPVNARRAASSKQRASVASTTGKRPGRARAQTVREPTADAKPNES